MTKTKFTPRKRWPFPIRVLTARPRLLISILAALVVIILLPVLTDQLRGVTRFLVGWDIGVGLYLILAFWMIAHSGVTEIRRQSKLQDEGGFAILLLTIVSASASFGAVFAWLEMSTRAQTFAPRSLVFLLITLILSWVFIHTMFALHYAHEYYAEPRKSGDGRKTGSGLIFPHDPEPTYWDFVYLAFSIGTATQVSDVEISSKRIRRTVTAHGIVAFFFNVTVIALTVGLLGDAIQT
jgi:uncharacterized membrane protein